MKTFTQKLPVQITPAEKLRFADLNAREVELSIVTESERKEVAAKYKAKIEGHSNEIKRLSRIISSGIEYREVECEKQFDWAKGIVQIVRLDTGEVVDERPMKPEEEQRTLDMM